MDDFPKLKTFKEEVADIAKRWAKQNKCSYKEATAIILDFAKVNHREALEEELNTLV